MKTLVSSLKFTIEKTYRYTKKTFNLTTTPNIVHIHFLVYLTVGLAVAQATPIASESFSYTPSTTLEGQTGGTGFIAGWSRTSGPGEYVSSSGSLNYLGSGALPPSGNKITFNDGGSAEYTRAFAGVSTGELWVSWLYTANAPFSAYSGLSLLGGQRFYFGDKNDNNSFVVNYPGNEPAVFTITTDQVYFLTARVQFDTSGSFDTVSLFVDGNTNTPDFTTSSVDIGTVGSIGLSVNSGGSFDEIRIGTTAADVSSVPEPSTYAYFTCAALFGVAMFRRRCHVS